METIDNRFLSISYKMYTIEEGEEKELVEETTPDNPYRFITGLGLELEAFEKQFSKLNAGDKFDFTIPMAEAYGEYNEEHVYNLPKQSFYIDGKFDDQRVKKAAVLPIRTSDGQVFNCTVTDVLADTVVIDMNHPFAGCDLNYVGEVLESRPATNEELAYVANMLSGHGHCGGGCGGCGGGCGSHGCGEGGCCGDC